MAIDQVEYDNFLATLRAAMTGRLALIECVRADAEGTIPPRALMLCICDVASSAGLAPIPGSNPRPIAVFLAPGESKDVKALYRQAGGPDSFVAAPETWTKPTKLHVPSLN